jgi:hypothetical protein
MAPLPAIERVLIMSAAQPPKFTVKVGAYCPTYPTLACFIWMRWLNQLSTHPSAVIVFTVAVISQRANKQT